MSSPSMSRRRGGGSDGAPRAPSGPRDGDSSSRSPSARIGAAAAGADLLGELLRLAEQTDTLASKRAADLSALDKEREGVVARANAALAAVHEPPEAVAARDEFEKALHRVYSGRRPDTDRFLTEGSDAASTLADTDPRAATASLTSELSRRARLLSPTGFISRFFAMRRIPELVRMNADLEVAVDKLLNRLDAEIRGKAVDDISRLDEAIDRTESELRSRIEVLAEQWRSLNVRMEAAHPGWASPAWREYAPPTDLPRGVRIGITTFRHGHTNVECPILWRFPGGRSLLLVPDVSGSKAVADAALGIVLRLIAGMPRGSIEVFFADPEGLGKNVAPVMHLRDYDSAIIHPLVLTDDADIERTLVDLTNHITQVNSVYLKGKFATIEEHNAAAGEIAVPYKFLVVVGYPNRFTQKAIDRIGDLVETGGSAGVHALVVMDPNAALPYGATHKRLTASCVTIHRATIPRYQEDGRRGPATSPGWSSTGLPEGAEFRFDEALEFKMGRSPDDTVFGMIIDRVGAATRASRVRMIHFADLLSRFRDEVMRNPALYADTAPSPLVPESATWWLASSEAGLDVPIGLVGATKVQRLRIGASMNHAAVIGANGTGKSTLLHTLIGALSLTYGPTELEFSLIDMKDGVGFKIYAGPPSLPHARTIAVMCDRGIAVDILKSLVSEMHRRFKLITDVTAATGHAIEHLGNYRRATGELMPRHLCIIDEFHDLTNGDDALATEANDLIRELVKKGRAAGIHLLLATQNVVGAGLRKDALSEIPIRVCFRVEDQMASEAALGDGNYAAMEELPTAETEQGVAIYNTDRRRSGNSVFKAGWIDRSTELPALTARLAARAAETGGRSVPRVFDSEAAPRIESDEVVLEALAIDPRMFLPAALAGSSAPGLLSPSSSVGRRDRRDEASVTSPIRSSMGRTSTSPGTAVGGVSSSVGRRKPPSVADEMGEGDPAGVGAAGSDHGEDHREDRDGGPDTGDPATDKAGERRLEDSEPGVRFGPPTVAPDGSYVLEGFVVEEEETEGASSGAAEDAGVDRIPDVRSSEPKPSSAVPRKVAAVAQRIARPGSRLARKTLAFLGQPMRIEPTLVAQLDRTTGRNIMMLGPVEEMAVGVVTGCALGALATCKGALGGDGEGALVTIVDFQASDSASKHLKNLAEGSDGVIDLVMDYRAEERIEALAREVTERQTVRAEGDGLPHLLVLFGLQVAHLLGSDDHYGTPSPALASFRTIVQRGPTVGVHVMGWADNYRAMTRLLRTSDAEEFSLRIAAGLAEGDLQHFLEGSRLRRVEPQRAAYQDQTGEVRIFRPYAPLETPRRFVAESVRSIRAAR